MQITNTYFLFTPIPVDFALSFQSSTPVPLTSKKEKLALFLANAQLLQSFSASETLGR